MVVTFRRASAVKRMSVHTLSRSSNVRPSTRRAATPLPVAPRMPGAGTGAGAAGRRNRGLDQPSRSEHTVRRRNEARLGHEIRREFGRDAEPLAERTDLVVDLTGAAVLALFCAEITDALRRPKARDEGVVAVAVGKVDVRRPMHRRVVGA